MVAMGKMSCRSGPKRIPAPGIGCWYRILNGNALVITLNIKAVDFSHYAGKTLENIMEENSTDCQWLFLRTNDTAYLPWGHTYMMTTLAETATAVCMPVFNGTLAKQVPTPVLTRILQEYCDHIVASSDKKPWNKLQECMRAWLDSAGLPVKVEFVILESELGVVARRG